MTETPRPSSRFINILLLAALAVPTAILLAHGCAHWSEPHVPNSAIPLSAVPSTVFFNTPG